jgi:hypothetical protein
VRLHASLYLRKLNGLWFECRAEPFPAYFNRGDEPWHWDYAEGKMIQRAMAHAAYGAEVYCVAKRQLSRRELHRHGLHNDEAQDDPFPRWEQSDHA